ERATAPNWRPRRLAATVRFPTRRMDTKRLPHVRSRCVGLLAFVTTPIQAECQRTIAARYGKRERRLADRCAKFLRLRYFTQQEPAAARFPGRQKSRERASSLLDDPIEIELGSFS
ncbi:MAG TPA: hypothetical protein VE258_17990, partial [Ktedonobacterales bacterium]|nr:hypothetical protein [Ktedonobacterales bacterium]